MSKEPWKTEQWWVSPLNFAEEVRSGMSPPDKVLIHDVTLRDGEQQAGLVFNKEEKIEIAQKLDEVGVQRIEAGMPAVSEEDREAIKAIANLGLDAETFVLTRCMTRDIDLALSCDVDGVVLEIPSSEHMIREAYKWSFEKALALPVEATSYAAEHGLYVSFFTVDGTRANLDWWLRIIDEVSTRGHMDSLVIVDTLGVCNPEAMAYFVRKAKERFNVPIEIHAHNDFGLGVANTLAGVCAGAQVVHTTVNCIGERVGNASLDEVALSLESLYGVKTGLKLETLYELSKLVQKKSDVSMPVHKPIVGDGVFRTESGLVVSWWLRAGRQQPLLLYPFLWDLVGQQSTEIILGKKSGLDSIRYELDKLGLSASEDQALEILDELKRESVKKKSPLSDEEFREIFRRVVEDQ